MIREPRKDEATVGLVVWLKHYPNVGAIFLAWEVDLDALNFEAQKEGQRRQDRPFVNCYFLFVRMYSGGLEYNQSRSLGME